MNRLAALVIALAASTATAAPAPTPSAKLTRAQMSTLGDVVPTGGFAHFAGHGTDNCPMPVLYASGANPWSLNIIAREAHEFTSADGADKPDLAAVQATFRATLAACGFPVPEAPADQKPAEGKPDSVRKMDPAMMGKLPAAATMAYLSGVGSNFHNLPAVFAMRVDEKPILVVSGKAHPMKSFALPEQWDAAMKAYAELLATRGYR